MEWTVFVFSKIMGRRLARTWSNGLERQQKNIRLVSALSWNLEVSRKDKKLCFFQCLIHLNFLQLKQNYSSVKRKTMRRFIWTKETSSRSQMMRPTLPAKKTWLSLFETRLASMIAMPVKISSSIWEASAALSDELSALIWLNVRCRTRDGFMRIKPSYLRRKRRSKHKLFTLWQQTPRFLRSILKLTIALPYKSMRIKRQRWLTIKTH